MKEYYEILDIPVTATPAEIKAQYRQLVRIYHPDRFMDRDDKAYAEEKLKEINIAFQVLSGTSVHREPFEARVAPQPVIYPPVLDFGEIAAGQKSTRKMQVGNHGGPAESINFVYSCEEPWFQVSKGQRINAGEPFPLNFDVAIDTRQLQPGQRHQEWLEVVLDGIPMRVGLQVDVTEQKRLPLSRLHWMWTAIGALSLLAALFLLPLLGKNTGALPFSKSLISANPAYELHSQSMLFAVEENDADVLYVGQGNTSAPRRLGIIGSDAVGTSSGQRIAYLQPVGNLEQIFLFELADGKSRQITSDNVVKSGLAWSPDGARLAYLVGTGTQKRIGLYNLHTGEEQLLPGEIAAGVSHFAWSSDGQSILFDLWQGDEQRVYRMGVRGDQLQQLTDFDSWAGDWSPDGTQILIGTDRGLYIADSDGQQSQQLTNVPMTSFRWSDDGDWIVYTTDSTLTTGRMESAEPAAQQTLWMMDRDGKDLRQITTENVWYAWGPDGNTLGYITGSPNQGESLFYLWTMRPGEMPTLVAEITQPFFSWSK